MPAAEQTSDPCVISHLDNVRRHVHSGLTEFPESRFGLRQVARRVLAQLIRRLLQCFSRCLQKLVLFQLIGIPLRLNRSCGHLVCCPA